MQKKIGLCPLEREKLRSIQAVPNSSKPARRHHTAVRYSTQESSRVSARNVSGAATRRKLKKNTLRHRQR